MSYPVLAFHGTKENNIHSICNTGFRVPGEENFEHATDTGKIISFLLKSHLRSKRHLEFGFKMDSASALFFNSGHYHDRTINLQSALFAHSKS